MTADNATMPPEAPPREGRARPPGGHRLKARVERAGRTVTVSLEGRYTFDDAPALWSRLRRIVWLGRRGRAVRFDLSGLESLDGGTAALLAHADSELRQRRVETSFEGASERVERLLGLYREDRVTHPRQKARPPSAIEELGRATAAFFAGAKDVFGFFGEMVLSTLGLLKEPRTGNWADVPRLAERAGADAVPVVALINFLVGFVMAYQSAAPLRQYGANLFVADLVALSVTKELGPLMTAILLCGRSGAAFAAELGTMRVSEELDALRTMGFGPVRFLVLPRAAALMLAAPALTLVADAAGIAGGLFVGVTSLDLSAGAYLRETRAAISSWSVFSGLLKSVAFALAVTLIACQQGFAASGGAEGVGRRTTSSVVASLFALIVIDAAFTVAFQALRLS
ncbi:MAG TPA: MlaE family lipid ABC transporter permease subunit [Polyangiaceae bacterium]|nr:MlaE family lipid ABC transporter permease subunit [Polyangiaceae bacterium]